MFDFTNSLNQDDSITENIQSMDLKNPDNSNETSNLKIMKYSKEYREKREIHQLYMSGGDREKMLVKERLFLYGKFLPEVIDAFSISKYTQKMTTIRKIQRITCEKFNLHTDRAAWRTKTGARAWFCMHWVQIKDYVKNIVRDINLDENKRQTSHCSSVITSNSLNSPNSSDSSSTCVSASSSISSISSIISSPDTSNNSNDNNNNNINNQNSQNNSFKCDETIEKLFPENMLYYFNFGDFDFSN